MEVNEITEEAKVRFREQQSELLKILEAFTDLETIGPWIVIKELVFHKSIASIERKLLAESKSPVINIEKLYKLQGELSLARQLYDVDRFIVNLKKQLEEIKKQLR